jgi:hypothetical protein
MVQEALYVREVTNAIPEMVSPSEAARRTSLSRSTIDRLCAQGRLEKKQVSDGRVAITVESIERHLAELNDPLHSARKRAGAARMYADLFPLHLDEFGVDA